MRQTRSRWRRQTAPRRRRGTFLIITVAGLLLFVGLLTLVADFGYTYAERQRVQGVIDMAGMTTLLTVDPLTDITAATSLDEILTQNGVDPSIVTSVVVAIDGLGMNLTVDATIPIDALFGNVYGWTQYSAAVTSMTTATKMQLPQPQLNGFGMFGCSSLTISDPMSSFDSAIGPNEGPPTTFPTITGCTSGTNCGDELLIGSNGDVNFNGGTVWGNVTAGGNITKVAGSPNRISKQARAGGTITGVDVFGTAYENEPFTPVDCTESAHFPDHFLESPAEPATHTHGSDTYTRKRAVETDAVGNDTNSDGQTDGTGPPGVDGFGAPLVTGGFTIETIKGPRMYTMGNRVAQGTGTRNGFDAGDEDILFHNSPDNTEGPGAGEGNEPVDNSGMPQWPLDFNQAIDSGGWVWAKDKDVGAFFRTGVSYFFHEMKLAGNRDHDFVGDWELDGPAVWFIHGNGQTAGDDDFSANNANFKYTGECGGMACTAGNNVPALRLYATEDSVLRMAGNYTFSVDVIAPGALVDLNGTSGVLGRVLGDVVDMSGTAEFIFDVQLLEGSVDQPFIPERAAMARIVY